MYLFRYRVVFAMYFRYFFCLFFPQRKKNYIECFSVFIIMCSYMCLILAEIMIIILIWVHITLTYSNFNQSMQSSICYDTKNKNWYQIFNIFFFVFMSMLVPIYLLCLKKIWFPMFSREMLYINCSLISTWYLHESK